MHRTLSVIFDVYQLLDLLFRSIGIDITAKLNEIASLNVENRIRFVEAIYDSKAAEQAYPDLTKRQKKELDYRIDD